LNPTAKKYLSYAIKALLLVLLAYFVYEKLVSKHDLKLFEDILLKMDRTRAIITMGLLVLFMFFNWGLEAAKWKYLTKKLQPMTYWESTQAVFCGLSWALLTPNRLGEYGGRVMFLPPRKRIHGVFAMAVGSFGQNVVTNVLGAIAVVLFCFSFLKLNIVFNLGILIINLAIIGMMLLFYFNMRWMVSLLNSIKFLRKYHRFFDIMARYKFSELVRIMGFCVARFAVFSSQYYFIIHFLVPEISLYHILMMIYVMFVIQSALPSLDLLDIGVRSVTAGTLFAYVTNQKIAIVSSVTSIWFINLIVPAVLGSIFVLKLKFFDNNS